MTRFTRLVRRLAIPVALIGAAVAFGGCGEEEFTAESFIDAMNEHGTSLTLGPVLTTNPEGIDINEVSFSQPAPAATGEGAGRETANGAATLLVFDGTGDAEDEFDRCESGPALTCFRASNAVLRVANLQPSDRALITTAIQGVGDDGS